MTRLAALAERLQSTARGRPALIGFPVDDNSSFLRGAAAAPPLIREALRCPSTNLWSEDGTNVEEKLFDAGDHESSIGEAIGLLLEHDHVPISLGGDHSITYPIVGAFAAKFDRLDLLQFDAHADLYDEFEGNRLSHACPFARILEDGLVRRLVQVGIRTMNDHQRAQARRFGVEVVEMRNWEPGRSFELDSPLYVSIDLDVLDPAFAPGVAHREPGGATTRQLLDAIQDIRVCIVGADLVELNPRRDPHGVTPPVCAKLIKELVAKLDRKGA